MQSVCLLVFVCMLHVGYNWHIRTRTYLVFFCTAAQHDKCIHNMMSIRTGVERNQIPHDMSSSVQHIYIWLRTKKQIDTHTYICMLLHWAHLDSEIQVGIVCPQLVGGVPRPPWGVGGMARVKEMNACEYTSLVLIVNPQDAEDISIADRHGHEK